MATTTKDQPSAPSRARTKPTPEEIVKIRAEREQKRQAREQAEKERLAGYSHPLLAAVDDPRAQLVEREWITLAQPIKLLAEQQRVTIKTWNLLAQCLVRRKLFPVSDCLKAPEREHMLLRELARPQADILCLQEVDRMETIKPFLEASGYDMVYACGPRKKHGSLIAFRKEKFELVKAIVVPLDTVERGASHKTKNIGNLVGIRERGIRDRGYIVATSHLFWHPSYTYERTRQAGLLLREATTLRNSLDKGSWPCILAGDFNFAPDDPAYALLVGAPLLPKHSGMLARSRVIHASIDPSVPVTTRKAIGDTSQGDAKESNDGTAGESTDQVKGAAAAAEDEEEEGGTDPDRAITNAREARPEDGLFTTADLRELYQKASAPARSTYDEAQKLAKAVATCGQRLELSNDRLGYDEPEWTSYTHYWKTVLDYIFVLDPATGDAKAQVLGYLKPPSTEQLGLGIPMKGITSSDHVSLTVELAWSHSHHD